VGIIKKDKELSILVFAFFAFAFIVFLFIKPSFTGMIVSIITPINIHDVNTGNSLDSTDTIGLSFSAGDEQSCTATLEANISNSAGMQIYFGTTTLQTFITSATPQSACVGSPLKYIASSSISLSSPITIFSGLNAVTFGAAGIYTFTLNFSNSSGLIDLEPKQFSVSDLPSDTTFPQITSVNFKNENGSSNFMMINKVNCSATVTDDAASVAVNYIMWGSNPSKTSITSPGKTGSMSCTGTSWSTGKTCSVSTKVEKSDLGYWNCTIEASDGTNKNYINSSVLLMKNSPPTLKNIIENLTWNVNENNTEIDLSDNFEDPDDQAMNYSASGNSHINISIKSNGDVLMTPEKDWIGGETVVFKADDEKGAETESNDVLLNVTILSSCAPAWLCGNWSDCIGGTQTRSCASTNNCTSLIGRPPLSQNCTGIILTCAGGDGCRDNCLGGDPDCSCTIQNGYLCGATQNCSSSILHSGTGVCCSSPCVTSVTTAGKSKTSGFFGSQTDKILIGVGSIAGVVFVVALVIILSTYINKKKALVEESKPAGAGQPLQQKSLDLTPVKIKPTNIDKMKDYIEQSLANKVPIRIVKGELSKVGWTESDVDRELNIARLRGYIQIKLNQGIPRAEIEQSLRMKGWSQDQISEASKNTKVRPLI